ncbi:hypothetical protein ACFLV7_11235 [Chloroflexota bacterium]
MTYFNANDLTIIGYNMESAQNNSLDYKGWWAFELLGSSTTPDENYASVMRFLDRIRLNFLFTIAAPDYSYETQVKYNFPAMVAFMGFCESATKPSDCRDLGEQIFLK